MDEMKSKVIQKEFDKDFKIMKKKQTKVRNKFNIANKKHSRKISLTQLITQETDYHYGKQCRRIGIFNLIKKITVKKKLKN